MLSHDQLNQFLGQIRNPDKRNWIIMVPNSLGETIAVCGLASSFIKKHGHGITLVIPESHAFIPQCYPGTFDRVVFMDLELIRQFSATGFIPPNFFNLDFPINTWVAQYGDGRIGSLHDLWIDSIGRSGLNFIDMFRYVLRLDWKSEFTFPNIPEAAIQGAVNLVSELKIRQGQTAVFFVGNNTNKPAPTSFWKKLAAFYQQRGIDVVINKRGSMLMPENLLIPGARMVDLPLDIAVPFCEYAGHAVSCANGFVALALAGRVTCKLNVLLTNEACCDYRNFLFKETNPLNGCHQLIMPELAQGRAGLREWLVDVKGDDTVLEMIAHNIVYEEDSEYLIASAPLGQG